MLIVGVILTLSALTLADDEAPILQLQLGKVQGKLRENFLGGKFYSFQGIPYAQPPINSLRFKPPEPIKSWDGIWDATGERAKCPQENIMGHGAIGDEDCLYINVYIPTLPTSSDHQGPKAVMVLLHGGGFTVGDGGEELFGPRHLMTEDIIYVAMNYRLNLFGFLSFDDPEVGVTGNMGLKDQVMALKWVKENIADFGGDPNRVTIFGESAGGAAVSLMLLSPLAKGLFHRAIAMSGVPSLPWVFTERRYTHFARQLQFKSENQKEIFDFINSKNANELITAQTKMLSKDEIFIGEFSPIGVVLESESDPGAFITKDPLEMFRDGEFQKVPMIMGLTKDEGIIFNTNKTIINLAFDDNEILVPKSFKLTKGSLERKKVGEEIKKFYYGDAVPNMENVRNFIDMMTDITFSHGIFKTMTAILENTHEPLYFYLFNYITQLNYMSMIAHSPIPTACHADDNGYLYPFAWAELEIERDSPEFRGVHRIVKLWTTFARTGNPNEHGSDPLLDIMWPNTTLENFNYLILQEDLQLASELMPERQQFWNELDKKLGIK